jgi:O-antigen/teichoic acid export membrane protein
VLRTLLQILQIVVLARVLTPQDFGLMAVAGASAAVAALFADFGLGSALMHFARPDRRTLSTIYWLNLAASCGLALTFVLLSWPLSQAFAQPALQPVLFWLSLIFPIGALGQPFRVMAEKDLQFSRLAQHEIAAAVLGFLVALLLAVSGQGVFAFVAAMLATAAANTLLAWLRLSGGLRPTWQFSLPPARPFLGFGLHRLGDQLWNTLNLQADIFIAGLHAAPTATAYYAVPREQCLRISGTIINPVVTRIGLPVMTRLQHDPTALRSVYLQTLRMTASLNFPVYAVLALFPEQIVSWLLGVQWLDSAYFLRLFALWGLIRSTGNPSGSLMYAVGMARRANLWNLTQLLITVPVLWVAARNGGLPALAWMMGALQAVVFVLLWRFAILPACGATLRQYVAQLMPPLLVTTLASVTALLITSALPVAWHLPFGILTFALVYLLLSWPLNRTWLHAMGELVAPGRWWWRPTG